MESVENDKLNVALESNVNSSNSIVSTLCGNGTSGDCNNAYYGVHIPADAQGQDKLDGYINVFQDKVEALKLVKKYKKARFKAFTFYHEAAEFAIHGSEFPNNNTTIDGSMFNKSVTDTPQAVGEKPTQFRGPKSQDLVKLRKAIENGDLTSVQKTIWDNPRYLISSGDTPSILQEGARYNALHVAAKAKNSDMCDLILNTVSNINFIKLLYGDDSHQDADERAKILLDLYLNTPDKGLNETPLHFAVKFGALKVVELLVSFPQCDKNVKNKYGKTPEMIICDRCDQYESVTTRLKIAKLLEETFYVPVLRSEDSCLQPVIGEPFSPTSPPHFNTVPTKSRVEIHAYAGPMDKQEAENFRKEWKSPLNLRKLGKHSKDVQGENKANENNVIHIDKSLNDSSHQISERKATVDIKKPLLDWKFSKKKLFCREQELKNEVIVSDLAILKYKDPEKGLELLGKILSLVHGVGWKEYWPFLDSFVDLSSKEGLQQLESYLASRVYYQCSSSCSSASTSNSLASPKIDCDHSSNLLPSSVISPVSDLCKAFEACSLTDYNSIKKAQDKTNFHCFFSSTDNRRYIADQHFIQSDLSPFLCIEKSCQVFANRILNDILYLLESEYSSTTDILESQMKQLQVLMASFMDDSRFSCIDFHLIHSRLSLLISSKLKGLLKYQDEHDYITKTLETWLNNYNKNLDYFSSDDESINHREDTVLPAKCTSYSKQVICVLDEILSLLNRGVDDVNTNVGTEEESLKAWTEAKLCKCTWQSPVKKRTSLGKKMNSFKGFTFSCKKEADGVSKRLTFDDEGDRMVDKDDLITGVETNSENNLSDEEIFYTPPSTPDLTHEDQDFSDDDDEFNETQLPISDIFIEGNTPTKMDYAVFNALQLSANLNPDEFPNVYKWHHMISLYTSEDRKSWTSPASRSTASSPKMSTPKTSCATSFNKFDCRSPPQTPPRSWIRVTGVNSPRASLKSYQGSISFNLSYRSPPNSS